MKEWLAYLFFPPFFYGPPSFPLPFPQVFPTRHVFAGLVDLSAWFPFLVRFNLALSQAPPLATVLSDQ